MTYNRAQRRDFPLRHEFLANMLGVHRPTISTAANVLQRAGLITYHYGKMAILDPEGLRNAACECYCMMEEQFENMFGQSWRDRVNGGVSLRS
jgi:Mn-dependent DtxR family transcriptional regulator